MRNTMAMARPQCPRVRTASHVVDQSSAPTDAIAALFQASVPVDQSRVSPVKQKEAAAREQARLEAVEAARERKRRYSIEDMYSFEHLRVDELVEAGRAEMAMAERSDEDESPTSTAAAVDIVTSQ